MSIHRPLLLVGAVLLLIASGCRQESHDTPAPEQPPPAWESSGDSSPALNAANLNLALKLRAKLAAEDPAENVFLSPTSLGLALAMCYNGARGETQAAMARTLGIEGLSLDAINQDYQGLQSVLGETSGRTELSLANSLWLDLDKPFVPAFLELNQTYYDARVDRLDFQDAESADVINRWVSEETRGKIPSIINSESLAQQWLVLINAVYFKDRWNEPFEKSDTEQEPFTLSDGTTRQVPLMRQEGEFWYMQDRDVQSLSLPYGNGRFSMFILLPSRESSLPALCKRLSAEQWETWLQGFADREGLLKLPRFTAAGDYDLKQALTDLGMGIAFDEERADFGGLGPVWLGTVLHKTFVQVDEEGTEAAAVTAVPGAGMAPPPPPPDAGPFEMIVDRPFLLLILDNHSGAILFLGSIVDPQEISPAS